MPFPGEISNRCQRSFRAPALKKEKNQCTDVHLYKNRPVARIERGRERFVIFCIFYCNRLGFDLNIYNRNGTGDNVSNTQHNIYLYACTYTRPFLGFVRTGATKNYETYRKFKSASRTLNYFFGARVV